MASPQASDKLATRAIRTMWDHDPDTTAATITTPDAGTTLRMVDMRDFGAFGAGAMCTVVAGGAITKIEIVASDDSAGATNLTVIKDSGTISANAQGDWAWLECTAEEIRQESEEGGYALRYVGLRITVSNSGSEAAVYYEQTNPKRAYDGMTAATTGA